MSFMYPRLVSFNRPEVADVTGYVAYGGQVQSSEKVLCSDIPASIQERREPLGNATNLPGDTGLPTWYVFIAKKALALGSVLARDVMIDETGERYKVIAPYWDSLGYRLTVQSLEA